jgi:hypothetical protein
MQTEEEDHIPNYDEFSNRAAQVNTCIKSIEQEKGTITKPEMYDSLQSFAKDQRKSNSQENKHNPNHVSVVTLSKLPKAGRGKQYIVPQLVHTSLHSIPQLAYTSLYSVPQIGHDLFPRLSEKPTILSVFSVFSALLRVKCKSIIVNADIRH